MISRKSKVTDAEHGRPRLVRGIHVWVKDVSRHLGLVMLGLVWHRFSILLDSVLRWDGVVLKLC